MFIRNTKSNISIGTGKIRRFSGGEKTEWLFKDFDFLLAHLLGATSPLLLYIYSRMHLDRIELEL